MRFSFSPDRLRAALADMQGAQRALFDDYVRLDRVAGPADLPCVPLAWRRTIIGWVLDGTVLPESPDLPHGGTSPYARPC